MKSLLIIFVAVIGLSAAQDDPWKVDDIYPPPLATPRIISGQPAALGQFPWQVALKFTQNGRYFCGGSLISAEWVLSAAHCFKDINEVLVIFGAVHVNKPSEKLTSNHIIIHPEYNAANLNNDIALVRLPSPVEFTTNIKPIPLIPRSLANEEYIGLKPLVAGFGYTSDEELVFSKILLFTQMEIRPKEDCIKIYGENVFKPSTICALGPDGTDQNICTGDSGGAMILDINGNKFQFGINSFIAGKFQCSQKIPSGFLRVGSYLDFIENETGIKLN